MVRISGIELAEGKYIVSMDSDGQHDLRCIKIIKILSNQKTSLMYRNKVNERVLKLNIAKYFLKIFRIIS